jgi:RNA polymerase sigma factor (sigma-70 family)
MPASSSSALRPPLSSAPEESVWIQAAQAGSLAALDRHLRQHQSWIFNLALRMVWRREVAEDATQEILLKAVTHLGSFEGRSKFSTWLYRIAVNHLLNVRKSEMEEKRMTFVDMARSLDECPDSDLPDESLLPIGHGLLVEEAKLGCITAMLMCLDRRQRLAFVFGEIFGVTSEEGAEIMEVSPANFRQLLTRARQDLYQFMQNKCGLVNAANPCRCTKKAGAFLRNGWLDPNRRQFTAERLASMRDLAASRLEELQAAQQAYAEVYRDTPLSNAPAIIERLRASFATPE